MTRLGMNMGSGDGQYLHFVVAAVAAAARRRRRQSLEGEERDGSREATFTLERNKRQS